MQLDSLSLLQVAGAIALAIVGVALAVRHIVTAAARLSREQSECIEDLYQRLEALEYQRDRLMVKIADLHSELRTAQTEIAQLRDRQSANVDHIRSLESERDTLHHRIAELRELLELRERRIVELEHRVAELERRGTGPLRE